MDEIYQLKEMLCKELEEYGRKGEMSAGTLEIVDKLAHAVKNLDKIIESGEEEYSNAYRGGSYRGGGSYEGGSYARGRGRNARRDSMGRYSSEGYSRNEDGKLEQVKQEIEQLMHKVDRM